MSMSIQVSRKTYNSLKKAEAGKIVIARIHSSHKKIRAMGIRASIIGETGQLTPIYCVIHREQKGRHCGQMVICIKKC